MFNIKRLLDDFVKAELALPELLSLLPSIVQQRLSSLQEIHQTLDKYKASGLISEDIAERIRQYLPETQPELVLAEGVDAAGDDEAATVVAYPNAGKTPADDEADPDAATVIAYPRGSESSSQDDLPGDEDDAATVVAYPGGGAAGGGGDGDDDRTVISNTVASSSTNVTDIKTRTHAGTGLSTSIRPSELSWDLRGANPNQQKLGPGSIIKERFILDKVLGAGGMGKVFQARDLLKVEAKDANPYVAMKVLTEDFKAHPQAFIALQREASRQQKLAHPNIATVFDFDRIGMTGTQVFITMELLVGKPLDTYIRKVVRPQGGLPFEEAFPIIKQLGAALSYAHSQGIVHSDFKPGNAFLCDDGVVKTLDFGIARAAAGGKADNEKKDEKEAKDSKDPAFKDTEFDAGQLGALTPAYASLEMLQGKDPSTQDDLYALACVAYELLTGYHPFNKKSALQAQEAKMVPAPIKSLKKRQMKGLLHGLAFPAEKRTPTVEQFLIELEGKPTWHKNPWVLGGAFSIALGVAAYNPAKNYLEDRRIESIISEVKTGDASLIERTIDIFPQFAINARNRIAEGGREVFQNYFKERINTAVSIEEQRYDFAAAEAELKRMALLFPDSAALSDQTAQLELQRNRYLHLLGQRITAALKREWLLPDARSPGRSVMEVLMQVAKIAPQHELLRDPRIPDAYATKAQEAINVDNLNLARQYLDTGLSHLPNDVDLINTQDRWRLALEEQQRGRRVDALLTRFGDKRSLKANQLLAASQDILELARLSPGNSGLKAVSAMLSEPLRAAPQQDATALLLALGLHDQLLERGFDGQAALGRLNQLLADPKADRAWRSEVLQLLAYLEQRRLATRGQLAKAKEKLVEIYLSRSKTLEESQRYSMAVAILDEAAAYRLDNEAGLKAARQRINQTYRKFLSEREQAAQQAHITGLQNSFTIETRARDVDAAEATLADLRQRLNERDPFLTVTAPEALAAAYLALSNQQSQAGEYRKAVALAERGLKAAPNDILLQQARERNLAEYDMVELRRLFASAEHFDTPAAQRMLDELRNFVPARYPELEREYVNTLTERILARAQQSRAEGERLATRAGILFPDSERLAQLRTRLAPPPWTDGRAARAALTTGRLNEAQGMLDKANRRQPDHPEVKDFAIDLADRKKTAEAAFAAYQVSLEKAEFEQAREHLSMARQVWSDNPNYRAAIATLSQRIAAQSWQGRIRRRDVDIRTLATAGPPVNGAEASEQSWTPIESASPCSEDLAGLGRRARAICYDMLHDRVRAPLMVVVPPMANGQYFAIGKYEVSNEDYNKYCFFTGQCPVDDSKNRNLPKTGLGMKEVMAYIAWLSERTGHTYRLPTRAEWLHVANAGGQAPPKDYNCTVRLGGQILKGDQIVLVSSGHQNGWGLQNVVGNVQELVQEGERLQAVGASHRDPHAECGPNFVRDHNGQGDEVTGFRLLLEEVQKPLQQTVAARP